MQNKSHSSFSKWLALPVRKSSNQDPDPVCQPPDAKGEPVEDELGHPNGDVGATAVGQVEVVGPELAQEKAEQESHKPVLPVVVAGRLHCSVA